MVIRVICGIAVVIVLSGTCRAQDSPKPRYVRPDKVYLCWNGNARLGDSVDQESFASALTAMGFSFARTDARQLQSLRMDGHTLLVIPYSSAKRMSDKQIKGILRRITAGSRLITDGPGRFAAALHMRLGPPVRISTVIDRLLPDVHLHWPDTPEVRFLVDFPRGRSKALYTDSSSGKVLGVTLRRGAGQIIYISTLFDSISGQGYSRFPTLGYAIVEELKCQPMFTRNGIDAYFDAGYRNNVPIEKLATLWRQWGIRAVHAAAWYCYSSPPYDYNRLIRAAHANGILVYAWLEWPHMGTGFWNQHPEWRQKNALGQDAKINFLHLMDLQNPDCLNAGLTDLAALLQEDWDGVDIAEFTITGAVGEALEGPARPDYFVPFTTLAIAEFKTLAGYDPRELLDPSSRHFWRRNEDALNQFYRYRIDVNNRLLRQVVEFVSKLKSEKKRDWELIHTIIDNSLHPEFDYLLAFDRKSTLTLLREYGVTLNVEDPATEWTNPPSRYAKLRRTLDTLIPERSSMIDINVVPIHPETQKGFAAVEPTGFELFEQIQSASEHRGRVCLYCESSVYPHDWQLIPHALSMGATATNGGSGWNVSCKNTVLLSTGIHPVNAMLDGKPWPGIGSRGVIVPAGKHRLLLNTMSRQTAGDSGGMHMSAISDELLDCSARTDGIELSYESPGRCLISLNRNPGKIWVDDAPANLPVIPGDDCFVLIAPSGRHKVLVSGR